MTGEDDPSVAASGKKLEKSLLQEGERDDCELGTGTEEGEMGIYTPPPKCLDDEQCPGCHRVCEASAWCAAFGRIGLDPLPFGLQRHQIMVIALVFSVLGQIFLVAGICAFSKDNDTVVNTAWAIGTGKSGHSGSVYVGLTRVATRVHGKLSGTDISDVNCDDLDDACKSCVNAVEGIQVTAIMGVITQVPQILTDIQRSTVRGDRNCQKFMGVATGIFGCLSTLAALGTFRDSCWRLQTEYYDMEPGPGFILTAVATILKTIDVVCHLILPTPRISRNQALVDEDGGLSRGSSKGL